MTDAEAAWLAGIIEGEGCIALVTKTSARLTVSMTDEDVVKHLYTVTMMGTVKRYPKPPHKDRYVWAVGERDDLLDILTAIRPWMGARRGARIDEVLSRLEKNPGRMREIEHGTVSGYHKELRDGVRNCASCKLAYNAARRERYRLTGR